MWLNWSKSKKTLINGNSHNIRVLDNLSTGTREDLLEACNYSEVSVESTREFNGIELVVGDILDEELTVKVTTNADVIIANRMTDVIRDVEKKSIHATYSTLTKVIYEDISHRFIRFYRFDSFNKTIG